MKTKVVALFLILNINHANSQISYFPPIFGNEWDTISPASLGWCDDKIDSLYHFLEERDTKGFLILKDGKIVLEKYFGTFTSDSIWYWASAGKTVTSFLTGTAQEEGYLNIENKTSDYLGVGWTQEPSDKEDLIKVRNHLTLTTGIDYDVSDLNCVLPECLQYLQDAGTGWYYHNATYLLIQDIIANATGSTYQDYYNSKLSFATGMFGLWYDGVLYSKPRSMARFGSLILNKGIWDTDTLLHDTSYFNQMINTSQELNLSYGYLFWLNGKSSYRLPGFTAEFAGELIPEAPDDMFMGLGKNDQKLYIIPSKNMVVVRMGNPGSPFAFALSQFDDILWEKINDLDCSVSVLQENVSGNNNILYPNPIENILYLNLSNDKYQFSIYDVLGKSFEAKYSSSTKSINTEALPKGIYFLKIVNLTSKISTIKKFVKG